MLEVAAGLIESKLARPRLREGIIDRPRVRDRFEGHSPVTLVSAPAGYGKTVAVESWLSELDSAVAWVSLDAGDNDPVRLWSYVAAAIANACDGIGTHAVGLLRTEAPSIIQAIEDLAARLATDGRPLTLVLEDLQSVDDERSLATLGHALGVLPANVRTTLITRADPGLPLARMRGRGELAEIRARELAFTVEEAELMLVDSEGLPLAPRHVQLLAERTEGWPAALYLAALWLRDVEPDAVDAALASFSGTHRHISEYLASEVLDGLSSANRMFLLRTSVLDRLSGELCDHVLGSRGSAERLLRIERRNLFLTALDADGRWFRYHELFRDLLRAKLDVAFAAALRSRASAWCRDHDLIEEAIVYARAAGDDAQVAALVDAHHIPVARDGRTSSMVHWLGDLPEWRLVERPGLAVSAALAAGALTRPEPEIRRLLSLARRSRAQHPEAWEDFHEAALAIMEAVYAAGDVRAAARHAAAAVEAAGDNDLAPPAIGVLADAQLLAGDHESARRTAKRAVAASFAVPRPFARTGALATLALVDLQLGRLRSARRHADDALAVARDHALPLARAWTKVRFADGVVAFQEGRRAHAERALEEAARTQEPGVQGAFEAWVLIELARVRLARGSLDDAASALSHAARVLAACADAGIVRGIKRDVAAALAAVRAGAAKPAELPSPAEQAVLALLPTPLSARQIADELFLSTNTVRTHVRVLYRKLKVHSRADAVDRAQALGLFDSPG